MIKLEQTRHLIWISIWDSVWYSVRNSVRASIWDEIQVAVCDTTRHKIKHLVVRDSIKEELND